MSEAMKNVVKNTGLLASFFSNTFMIKSDMGFFFQQAQESTNEFIQFRVF